MKLWTLTLIDLRLKTKWKTGLIFLNSGTYCKDDVKGLIKRTRGFLGDGNTVVPFGAVGGVLPHHDWISRQTLR